MSLIRADADYLWPGLILLGVRGRVQRPGHGALQRHAARIVDAGHLGADLRIRFGGRVFRQRPAAADRLPRVDRQAMATPAGCSEFRLTTAGRCARQCFSPPPGSSCSHCRLLTMRARRGACGRRDSDRVPRRLPQAVDRADEQWRRDRHIVYYLVASAVFRDGLTGVFQFGAVLGAGGVRRLASRTFCCSGCAPAWSPRWGRCWAVCSTTASGSKAVIVGSLSRDDRGDPRPVES